MSNETQRKLMTWCVSTAAASLLQGHCFIGMGFLCVVNLSRHLFDFIPLHHSPEIIVVP